VDVLDFGSGHLDYRQGAGNILPQIFFNERTSSSVKLFHWQEEKLDAAEIKYVQTTWHSGNLASVYVSNCPHY